MSRKKLIVLELVIIYILHVLMVFLTSCNTDFHLRKSKKHYQKAIEKGYKPTIDTVFVIDTIITTQVQHDTTFVDRIGDTVLVEKDRLKIRYMRTTDSVFIEGECLPDTVVKQIPVTVQETIYIDKPLLESFGINLWWEKLLFWLAILLLLLLILWRIIK